MIRAVGCFFVIAFLYLAEYSVVASDDERTPDDDEPDINEGLDGAPLSSIVAEWTEWSPYSKCLQTDWGGIQIKERICKSGPDETPGFCKGRGSSARRCAKVKRDFRIRKNVKDLTDEEIHDLIQAMTNFKRDNSDKGFRYIASLHGWPGSCPWNRHLAHHQDGHCAFHHHPLFLPWHRLFTLQLELGLSRHLLNKTLGIPFWDWTAKESELPYIFRRSEIYDPVLKKYVHNPFRRAFIKFVMGRPMYSQRNPTYSGILNGKYHLNGLVRGLFFRNHFDFDTQIAYNPHDQIHNCMCTSSDPIGHELCRYGLLTTAYASWDPAFMFHHSAIDRLFVMRRKLEDSVGLSDWTKSRVMGQYLAGTPNRDDDVTEAFDWPLSPFCNKSLNSIPETNKKYVSTLRNSYYGEELFGYKYADFDFESYTWKEMLHDYKDNLENRGNWRDGTFNTKFGQVTKMNSLELGANPDICISASPSQ